MYTCELDKEIAALLRQITKLRRTIALLEDNVRKAPAGDIFTQTKIAGQVTLRNILLEEIKKLENQHMRLSQQTEKSMQQKGRRLILDDPVF